VREPAKQIGSGKKFHARDMRSTSMTLLTSFARKTNGLNPFCFRPSPKGNIPSMHFNKERRYPAISIPLVSLEGLSEIKQRSNEAMESWGYKESLRLLVMPQVPNNSCNRRALF